MPCWILGSILVAVLGVGVLGQGNTNCKEWLNYDYYHYAREQRNSCGLARPESFQDGSIIEGNKVISAVTTACRIYPVVRECLSNITAQCSQHSPVIAVAERDHLRLCNGAQPADWYLNVMTNDFALNQTCADLLYYETRSKCPYNGLSPFRVRTERPVSVWLSRAESYMSTQYSCLITNLETTIAEHPMCDVKAADVMLYVYSYFATDRQVNPGLSPSDDVFESFQAFVAPPSRRDSLATDWLFTGGI